MVTYIPINVLGENDDIGTGDVPEELWTFGGAYPFPAVARQLTVRSTSANDGTAGTGARTAEFVFLDDSFNQYTVQGTINGVGTVNIGGTLGYRINDAYILTAGSNETNVGTILVECGGTVIAEIQPNQGHAQQVIYTVPAHCTEAELIDYMFSKGRSTSTSYGDVSVQFRPVGGAWRTISPVYTQSDGDSAPNRPWRLGYGPTFAVGTDIRARVVDVSATSRISGELTLRLVVGATIATSAT